MIKVSALIGRKISIIQESFSRGDVFEGGIRG